MSNHPPEALVRFLNYVPSGLRLETQNPTADCCTSLHHFYDTHIGEDDILKRIVVVDDLCDRFLGVAHESLDQIDQRELVQLRESDSLVPGNMNHIGGVDGVAERYFWSVGACSCSLAGALLLHHRHSDWDTPLATKGGSDQEETYSHSNYSLCVSGNDTQDGTVELNQDILPSLSEKEKVLMLDLLRLTPHMASWQLFPPTEEAASVIQDIKSSWKFPWRSAPTKGAPLFVADDHPRHDAKDVPWTLDWIESERAFPSREAGPLHLLS